MKRFFILMVSFIAVLSFSGKAFSQGRALAQEYSFNNAFDSGYGSSSTGKKWFAIGAHFITDMDSMYLPDYDTALGYGISAELFVTKFLSFYTEYTSTYQVSESRHMYDANNQKVFFGPRMYFGVMYMGIGAVTEFLNYGYSNKYGSFSVKTQVWSMYTQFGASLPIAKNLSVDVGVNVVWDLNDNTAFDYDSYNADTTFYVGIKYSI